MELAKIFDRIKAVAAEAELRAGEEPMDSSVYVPRESLLSALTLCKEDKELSFEQLQSQTASQVKGEESLKVIYHLYSYSQKHRLVVETSVPLDDAKVDSVYGLWKTADWLERETYDLFGVDHVGHPDQRRLMLPEDWEGFPLRKDYVAPTSYQGIDNSPSEITKSFAPTKKKA